ncbi:MAG: ParA family protein [Hyphomonadaceae bacterium]|nr:ParA family protein [Hyphomonadaceae bacterium]
MPVVIALISQKGGVGKSTLARAIAAVAAGAGLKVRLVDLDPQQRTLLLWEKARRDNEIWPEITIEALATSEGPDVRAPMDDVLILDLPGQMTEAALHVALRAHLVVQPTGPSRDDLHPGVLVFHALQNCGVPRDRLVFALCRLLTKAEEDKARSYLAAAGYAVLPGAIPERAAYREALDRGRSLTEIDAGLDELVSSLMAGLFRKVEEQAYATSG